MEVDVEPDTPVLWVLRDHLKLVGTKYGCGMAQCGACTIHLNGAAVRSCVITVSSVEGQRIKTIEACHPMQATPCSRHGSHDVPQCGYYQAGQIMTAAALLANGVADKQNFDTYRMIRHREAPGKIEVRFVPGEIDPTGLGEPPFPPIFGALANALYPAPRCPVASPITNVSTPPGDVLKS